MQNYSSVLRIGRSRRSRLELTASATLRASDTQQAAAQRPANPAATPRDLACPAADERLRTSTDGETEYQLPELE